MIRIMPDLQVGPFGFTLMWAVLIVIAVGALFATGVGGAIVWGVFWIAAAFIVYMFGSKLLRRLT